MSADSLRRHEVPSILNPALEKTKTFRVPDLLKNRCYLFYSWTGELRGVKLNYNTIVLSSNPFFFLKWNR